MLDEAQTLKWDTIDERAWFERRDRLRKQADLVVADPKPSPGAIVLLMETGRSAENANEPIPPYYDLVDGEATPMYYWHAAKMLVADPSLASTVDAHPSNATVHFLRQRILKKK